ncbi:MAG: hypothetical protein KDD64_12005 [Bdellovibrionales bacterium]|nr:hypothetical protein [Bdellovibrionales bacterium]
MGHPLTRDAEDQVLETEGGEEKLSIVPENEITRASGLRSQESILRNGRFLFATFAITNVLIYRLVLGVEGYLVQESTILTEVFCLVSALLLLLTAVISFGPTFHAALRHVRSGRISSSVNIALMILGSVGLLVHQLAFDFEGLAQSGLADVFVGVFFFAVLLLETRKILSGTVKSSLGFSLERYVHYVKLVLDVDSDVAPAEQKTRLHPVGELRPGHLILCAAGEMVPCDGGIKAGVCHVNERRFGGRVRSCIRGEGQALFAGSRIVRGEILLEAAAEPLESEMVTFAELLNVSFKEEAQERFRFAAKFDQAAQALLLFFSLFAVYYWSDFHSDLKAGILAALAMLLTAPILSLVRSFPLLKGMALTDLFSKGVFVRGAHTITELSEIRSFFFDGARCQELGSPEFCAIEMVDDRIDREQLVSVLVSLVSISDRLLYRALSHYLFLENPYPVPYSLSRAQTCGDLGLFGELQGAEVTVGTEELLLERGVQLLQSETVCPEGMEVLFAALGDEVVARLFYRPAFTGEVSGFLSELRKHGVRPVLFAEDVKPEAIDEIGKRAGFELAEIRGGVKLEGVLNSSPELAPAGAFPLSRSELSRESEWEGRVVPIDLFDALRFNISDFTVLVMENSLSVLSDLFRVVNRFRIVRKVVVVLWSLLTVLLLVSGSAHLIPLLPFSLSVAVSCSAIMLLALLLLPGLPQPKFALESERLGED